MRSGRCPTICHGVSLQGGGVGQCARRPYTFSRFGTILPACLGRLNVRILAAKIVIEVAYMTVGAFSLRHCQWQVLPRAPSRRRIARFEGPDGQTVLLYLSDPAQCDPFGITSAPSFTSTTTTQTNMDLPAPDVEGYKGGNTSACYQQLLQVIASNSGGGGGRQQPGPACVYLRNCLQDRRRVLPAQQCSRASGRHER